MITFSFKREAKLYVVFRGERYTLDFSTLDFSQSFEEHSYSNKTLQIKNMFEQSIINKANPANFSITFPAIREPDLRILFNRALDYDTFDLYAVVGPNVFMVETCVITNLDFIMEKARPLTMSVSGEASKVAFAGSSDTFTVPGTPVARNSTRTYNRVEYVHVVANHTVSEGVNTINVGLQTDVTWTPYTTVNDAIDAYDRDSSMYPQTFSVKKREVTGNFTSYFIKEPNWDTETPVFIQAGERVGDITYGFEFDIKETSFTSSLGTGDIFTYQHNWRMTQNPDSLAEVIKYIGYTGDARAIQDHLDFDILDHLGNPILESI